MFFCLFFSFGLFFVVILILFVVFLVVCFSSCILFHCVLFFWTETGISSGTGDYDHMVKCGARLDSFPVDSGMSKFEIAENHQKERGIITLVSTTFLTPFFFRGFVVCLQARNGWVKF